MKDELDQDDDRFWEIYKDCFDPNESDLDYFLRRKAEYEEKSCTIIGSPLPEKSIRCID